MDNSKINSKINFEKWDTWLDSNEEIYTEFYKYNKCKSVRHLKDVIEEEIQKGWYADSQL